MKLKLCILFSALALCNNSFAFSSLEESQLKILQSEFNRFSNEKNEEKSQMRGKMLEVNIQYFENSITQKIKKNEVKLKKYENNLKMSLNGEEVQNWLKKMQSTEKKITYLNEILFGIEMLKVRFIN